MAETRLVVIYSVTSTTNTTQLFKVTGNFVKAELADGTQLPDSIFSQENKAYLFSQTGDTSVFYTLCGNTLVNNEFEGMTRIVGVNIPSNVTYIPEWCFSYCQNLSAVTFPDTLTGFGESAFSDTGLRSIDLPSSSFTLHNTTFASTQLERINVSATTAPVLTPTTFQFVPTGGTLVYPEGSDYSSWLSTDPYYLGYYGWSGVTVQSGSSVEYLRSQRLVLDARYNGPFYANALLGKLVVVAVPYGSNPDIKWTIGHNDLNMVFSGNTEYGYSADQANNVVTCMQPVVFDSTIEGYTDVTIRETTSNYVVSLRVVNSLSGSSATPSVLLEPFVATLPWSGYNWPVGTVTPGPSIKIADFVCNGFTPTTNRVITSVSLGLSEWENDTYCAPWLDLAWSGDHQTVTLSRVAGNDGPAREMEIAYASTYNTNFNIVSPSATSFVCKLKVLQEPLPTPSGGTPNISLTPSSVTVSSESGKSYIDFVTENCTLLDSITGPIYADFALSSDTITCARTGDKRIKITWPENTQSVSRSGMVMTHITDTDNRTYHRPFTVTQLASGDTPTPSGSTASTIFDKRFSLSSDTNRLAYMSAVSCNVFVDFEPADANLDIVYSFGHNDLFTDYGQSFVTHGTYATVQIPLVLNATADGYSDITVTDRNSNLSTSIRIYNRPEASTSSPRLYFSPSAVTISSAAVSSSIAISSGLSADCTRSHGNMSQVFLSGVSDWGLSASTAPHLYVDGIDRVIMLPIGANTGATRDVYGLFAESDTNNRFYVSPFYIVQEGGAPDPPIPSGSTVDSGGTGQTVTYSGCPLVFDHSASTGTWNVLPTVTTGGTSDNWWFNYNVPANDTTSARTITYYYLRYSGASCDELVDTVSYTISQAAGSGSTPMKNITLTPTAFTVSSASTGTSVAIYPDGCVFSSFTITSHVGAGFVNNPTVTGSMLMFTYPANAGSLRTDTFTFQLFDTDGDSYNATVVLTQAGRGSGPGDEPDPWSKPEDSGYTWYTDDNLLRILPATKTLSYDEVTGYWPVTAHSFNNVEVRASGDVVFTYELIAESDQSYNSHKFYAHTEDNLGVAQQVSTIKLVAYSGTSAYSASTVLMKNPASSGWITASPNPVNANSQESQVNVYLTLTSCQRNINKEITDNPTFDAASWVTVTRVNNTTLTFNFQANTGNQPRSTYYYAYGLDAGGNNVYCRIDITQEANSMGITIIPDRTSLGKEAGSFTARVESTESGNFSFTTSPWMSVTSYVPSTPKSGTLYIDYSENLSNWPRTGVITATQQISTYPYTLSASTQISQSNTADTGYIRITPSTISVSRAAGVVEAQVSYGGLATYPQIVDDGGNMSIVSYDLDSNLITVSYNANDTSLAKSRTFLVTGMSSNGNVISATFVINQGGTGLPVAPIWRDYVLDLPVPGQGYINYSIDYDGTVVYTGRAYGMGQDNIHLFYNHLCKSFLSNHIDFTEGYQTIREWLGNFTITSPELGNITSVSFFEDYSYENRSMSNTMSLNNPITNEVVAGGLVPFSFFVTGASGNVSIYSGSSQITGLTISDNEQHRYFVEAEEGSTYTALGARYKAVSACEARYSLYYVNSYGGVDVIPFKGKSFKKTDTITRLNYSRSFRNNTLEFENVNYMNEIKPAWELNTHYLVDSQASKMHELVESTCVYLYDAEEQTYTPVVMTDKKLEYKTFYNQGRKFYTYTINVEESQSKERR